MQNKDEELKSIVDKIELEISEVKNNISDAKHDLQTGNTDKAIEHLTKAKKVSSCSFCIQKINKFLADVEYSSKLCSINYKTCDETKNNTITEMQQFIDHLPSISDIKKNKNISTSQSQNFDMIGSVAKSFDEMGKSMGKMWESVFKW